MKTPAPWLLGAVASYAGALGAAGLAVVVDALPDAWLSTFMRQGLAAAGLGTIYAAAAPTASLGRRLSFPLVAAALNLLALYSAPLVGRGGEALGLPLVVGLTSASALWCTLFVASACRWLRWPARLVPLLLWGALAGAVAFGLFVALRATSAAVAPLTAQLAAYWAGWMLLATLTIRCRTRADARA